MAADKKFWDRAAKVAGMLGSEHDHEVLSAVHRLGAMLKAEALTWADFVKRVGTPRVDEEDMPPSKPFNPGDPFADIMADYFARMRKKKGAPSKEKQRREEQAQTARERRKAKHPIEWDGNVLHAWGAIYHETDKALLIQFTHRYEEDWIPKSQIIGDWDPDTIDDQPFLLKRFIVMKRLLHLDTPF